MLVEKFGIFIKGPDYKHKIEVNSADTIAQVKNKIKESLDIDVKEQELYLGGTKLGDEKTLAQHGIEKEEIIQLNRIQTSDSSGFDIYVRGIHGRSTPIHVNSSYTVERVKKQYQDKNGWTVESQRYIYSGRELENSRYLSDYNITESATLNLVARLNGGALFEAIY
jgi:hypothetical protein